MSTPPPSAPTTREMRRKTRRRNLILILGIPAILIVIGGGYVIDRFVYRPATEAQATTSVEGPPPIDASIQTVTTPSGLQYQDIVVGTGNGSPTRHHGQRPLYRLAHRWHKVRFFSRPEQTHRIRPGDRTRDLGLG